MTERRRIDLTELLDVEHVRLGMHAGGWESAVRALAGLFRDDEVTGDFERAIVERERQYPTGLPTKPFGVALPHADPNLVLKPRLAVLTLESPVVFGEMGNPDREVLAHWVIGIALPESEKERQTEMLTWLIEKVQRQQWVETVLNAVSAEKIVALFR